MLKYTLEKILSALSKKTKHCYWEQKWVEAHQGRSSKDRSIILDSCQIK